MATPNSPRQFYFGEFATLISTIARNATNGSKFQPEKLFEEFVHRIRRQGSLLPETGPILFRFLFPEEDHNHKYGLQEASLSRQLIKYLKGLGFGEAQTTSIKNWAGQSNNLRPGRSGCLGEELGQVLRSRNLTPPKSRATINDIDILLGELARLCRFTQLPSRPDSPGRRPQSTILTELYNLATPDEAVIITQIILKDLRPVLYPLEVIHTTRNLLKHNAPSNLLVFEKAMSIWDPNLPRIYRVCSNITDAFRVIEDGLSPTLEPVVGVPVQIPKCYKGRSCKDALKPLASAKRVYCETKYDGERMQIHIDLKLPLGRQITIFSKSKRDSTLDRYATHEIIRASLGLPQSYYEHPLLGRRVEEYGDFPPHFHTSIILEAEMVAYSERSKGIDEFWRIRDLIAETAKGIRGKPRQVLNDHIKARSSSPDTNYRDSDESSYESSDPSPPGFSLESNGIDDGNRHFMVVFFDVIYIDGRNLLKEPYSNRRTILKDTVRELEGFSKLASRTPIDMTKSNAEQVLQAVLAASSSQFEEGLVLKGDNSLYNSAALPWVKFKRDYIPGLGDCVDMAIIGAGWEKERARELGVGTDTFTTFYVAVLPDEPITTQTSHNLTCLFSVSYGMSREELERLNFEIKARSPILWRSRDSLTYTVTLCPGLSAPSVLFQTPLLFELFGAGFDKPPRSMYYVLRWPRVSKIHRTQERPWTAGETLASFTAKAYKAVGRDSTKKRINFQVANMWQATPDDSPEARSFTKRRAIELDLLTRLRGNVTEPSKKAGPSIGRPPKATLPPVQRSVTVNDFPSAVPDALNLLRGREDSGGYSSDSSRAPRKRRREVGTTDTVASSKRRRVEEILTIDSETVEEVVSTDVDVAKQLTNESPAPMIRPRGVFPPHPPLAFDKPLRLPYLMKDAFSVVIRPLYPAPKRSKGRPSLKTIFPAGSLVSTLEALLVGVEWTPRTYPFWKTIMRGLVFVDDKDEADVIARLERRRKELIDAGKSATEIFVISKTYLDIYIDSNLQETVVEPLWHSHPHLRKNRANA